MYNVYLKNNLKKIRLEKGLTQAQLSRASGVSIRTISSIECGYLGVSLYSACCLCIILDCNINDMFYFE